MTYGQGSLSERNTGEFTCCPTSDKLIKGHHTVKFFDREHGSPIPFSKVLAKHIRREVSKAFRLTKDHLDSKILKIDVRSSKPWLYDPPTFGSPDVDGEVKRFICALAAYFDPRNAPKMSFHELMEGIEDEFFVDKLKKLRFKSMVASPGGIINGEFMDNDPELRDLPVYFITDIGQIFNYRYWLFWDAEDPGDEEICFTDIKPLPEKFIEDFRTICDQMLPQYVDKVDKREILLQATSSSCRTKLGNKSSNWLEKENTAGYEFSTGPIHADLVYVQKCPGDTRRASVLTVPQSNTVKLLEKQVYEVVKNMKHSAYNHDKQIYHQRFSDFKDDYKHFICRDVKKDGLTKNRELVTLVLQILDEKFPHLELTPFVDFYKTWTFTKDGTLYKPKRGVGLGMTSAITTLIYCILCDMVIYRLHRDGEGQDWEIGGLFYHDDAAIGFNSLSDLEDYDSMEDLIFEEAGIIKNKRKSFSGDSFVLCEVYSADWLNEKTSYQLYLLLSPYYQCNIVQAKESLQQLLRYETKFNVEDYLEGYIHYWGYEFFREEYKLPYTFGGWLPAIYHGVDISFWFLEEVTPRHYQALIGCNNHTIEQSLPRDIRYNKQVYRSPLEKMFGPNLELQGFEGHYHYRVTHGTMHSRMTPFNGPGEMAKAYHRLWSLRRYDYLESLKIKVPMSKLAFYKFYCEQFKFRDVLPPINLCKGVDIEDLKKDGIQFTNELPSFPNPLLGYIKYWNPTVKGLDKVIPIPVPPQLSFSMRGATNEDRKRVARAQGYLTGTYKTRRVHDICIDTTHCDFTEFGWINPTSVAEAYTALNLKGVQIPLLPMSDNIVFNEIKRYKSSEFNWWYSQSKYKSLFRYLVTRVGWDAFKESHMYSDELYQMFIDSFIKQIQAPVPTTETDPVLIPLPKVDWDEIEFLGSGFLEGLKTYVFKEYDPSDEFNAELLDEEVEALVDEMIELFDNDKLIDPLNLLSENEEDSDTQSDEMTQKFGYGSNFTFVEDYSSDESDDESDESENNTDSDSSGDTEESEALENFAERPPEPEDHG